MIVSQDKHILNYDNVIEICKTFGNEKDVSIIATTINDDIVLGEFDTEKRADEILEEITNTFSAAVLNGTHDEIDLILKAKFVARYEMPKE